MLRSTFADKKKILFFKLISNFVGISQKKILSKLRIRNHIFTSPLKKNSLCGQIALFTKHRTYALRRRAGFVSTYSADECAVFPNRVRTAISPEKRHCTHYAPLTCV